MIRAGMPLIALSPAGDNREIVQRTAPDSTAVRRLLTAPEYSSEQESEIPGEEFCGNLAEQTNV